ncbi:MAG TPA: class I SAM-dependent methyltransferase [Enorma massiliensis]|uniref:class I SAM-dependent methyltransferase n=1 Tax=Enorma massiliensis TaxID=1472761 RepID=UPI001DD169AD|nr:class I SAM-dependent methyltransferase [Enorma massiliensis]HJG62006.1 class I SAM-dependent methyltransferase [Enorma massiliensis]
MDEGIDRQAGVGGAADSGQLDARAEKGEMPAPQRLNARGRGGDAPASRRSSARGRKGEAPAPRRFNVHGRKGSKPAPEQLKARSKAAFDEQAPIYDEGMQGDHARALYPCIFEEARRAMEGIPVPSVLDVGCGTGMLSERLLGAFPSCHLAGVDLSPAMVECARARLAGRAEVREADAERLPFHDGAFDLVVCNDSFHHYPDPDRAAFQMWRVLRKGGALVLGDVWQPAPARAVMNAWMPFSHEGDVRIYSEAELRAILGTWFQRVRWSRIGLTGCLAVASKG